MMMCWSFKMNLIWFFLLLFLYLGVFSFGSSNNVSSRPAVVNIGAIFTFDSTIGKVAKLAIEEAVKDVNSNSSVLHGTKLAVKMRNSNCSGFGGMVQALQFMETDIVAIIGPQSSVVAHIISHVANELQVPLLSFAATDPTLSSLQFPFFVRTTHSDLYQMSAVAQIVDHYGWKEVIAIFIDDDYGRNGMSALEDKLAERRCRISYKLGIPPGPGATRGDIMDLLGALDDKPRETVFRLVIKLRKDDKSKGHPLKPAFSSEISFLPPLDRLTRTDQQLTLDNTQISSFSLHCHH